MSSPAKGSASPTRAATAGSSSPGKSPGRVTRSSVKKESFQWNTPADEFAEDVASDAEEDVDFVGVDGDDVASTRRSGRRSGGGAGGGTSIEAEIDGETYQAHRTEDGEIIIHLGVEEAEKFQVTGTKGLKGGETTEEIQKFLDSYKDEESIDAKLHKVLGGKIAKSPKGSGGAAGKSKQKFQCPKCDKIWNWPWELRRHVLTHYKEKERQETATYKCEECGRGFQWKRDLAQHKRLHTGEKLLVCSVCEKKFTTRQALLHHVVVHTGEKPFVCAMCGNRFTQPANLRTHMKKKHGESHGIRGNKCPHCQDTFASIIAVHQHILEDHQNIVAADRENQSLEKMKREEEKQERERKREENRRRRMERKKEKMDYHDFRAKGLQEWEINYEFHIAEGLVKGVDWDRTPSNGELACEICDRKFGWRYEMMFHNLCHKTDEIGHTKNRVCPECDTAFKVPIGLKHHLLLHTGELPFLCLHCWRSFASHIDLKLHIRKEHLSHLEPPAPTPSASSATATPSSAKKRTPKEETPSRRTPKRAKAEPASAIGSSTAVGTTTVTVQSSGQHSLTESQLVAAVQAATSGDPSGLASLGDNVQVMVANQGDEGGENQTILVNSDGSIVHTGDQDMIVVIQGDENASLEQVQAAAQAAMAQGGAAQQQVVTMGGPQGQQQQLIVLDQSQLQQVVGADGGQVTLVEAGGAAGAGGEAMILGESEAARVLQLAGGSLPEGAQIVVANSPQAAAAATAGMESGGVRYVLASPPHASQQQAVAVSEFASVADTATTTTTLVMEAGAQAAANGSEETTMIVADSVEPTSIVPEQMNGGGDEAGGAEAAVVEDTKAGLVEKKVQMQEKGKEAAA